MRNSCVLGRVLFYIQLLILISSMSLSAQANDMLELVEAVNEVVEEYVAEVDVTKPKNLLSEDYTTAEPEFVTEEYMSLDTESSLDNESASDLTCSEETYISCVQSGTMNTQQGGGSLPVRVTPYNSGAGAVREIWLINPTGPIADTWNSTIDSLSRTGTPVYRVNIPNQAPQNFPIFVQNGEFVFVIRIRGAGEDLPPANNTAGIARIASLPNSIRMYNKLAFQQQILRHLVEEFSVQYRSGNNGIAPGRSRRVVLAPRPLQPDGNYDLWERLVRLSAEYFGYQITVSEQPLDELGTVVQIWDGPLANPNPQIIIGINPVLGQNNAAEPERIIARFRGAPSSAALWYRLAN